MHPEQVPKKYIFDCRNGPLSDPVSIEMYQWKTIIEVTVGLEVDHIPMLSNECLALSLFLLASLFSESTIQFLRNKRKRLGYKKMPPKMTTRTDRWPYTTWNYYIHFYLHTETKWCTIHVYTIAFGTTIYRENIWHLMYWL